MRRITPRPHIVRSPRPSDRFVPVEAGIYHLGLVAAKWMDAAFPDFFRTHVANQFMTFDTMIKVGFALVNLVRQQVRLDDWFCERATPLSHMNPAAVMDGEIFLELGDVDEDELIDLLAEFIDQPPLEVYGVGWYASDGEYAAGSAGPLTGVLLWLTRLTPAEDVATILPAPLSETLMNLPRADCRGVGQNLSTLCAALDEQFPGDRFGGIGLGTLMAYAHGTTGNFFADMHPDEFYDLQVNDVPLVSWDLGLTTIARDQAHARTLATAFADEERALTDPLHLATLATQITTVATALGIPVIWPQDPMEAPYDHRYETSALATTSHAPAAP